jgi:plastocyanin
MSKKITVLVVVILVVIIGVVYFLNKSPKGTVQTSPEYTATATPTPSSTAAAPTVTPTPAASAKATPPVSKAETYNISVVNFTFNPAALNIKKGDTVIWTNQDSVSHQIAGGTFNGPVMSNGQSYTFTFNSTGTFNYHCAIHPSMTGTITVK